MNGMLRALLTKKFKKIGHYPLTEPIKLLFLAYEGIEDTMQGAGPGAGRVLLCDGEGVWAI
jgi:hypothetical protein